LEERNLGRSGRGGGFMALCAVKVDRARRGLVLPVVLKSGVEVLVALGAERLILVLELAIEPT